MKIAFIVFNDITWLDFIGIYDPISRLKSLNYMTNLHWDICAYTDKVTDSFGLEILPTEFRNNLAHYDAVIIPGGIGTRTLLFDNDFLNWIKTAYDVKYKISICTGSLILGACGFLIGKKATTHYQAYETLKPYCKEVLTTRIVDDNSVITSGAVSASLDLGLYLCEKWVGPQAKNEIKKRMDYKG